MRSLRLKRRTAIPRRHSPFDAEAAQIIEQLRELNVQRVASQEELLREHTARLARFATTRIPLHRWEHLKRCRGGPCPHARCNAACVFGERYAINKLVLEGQKLMRATRQPLWFVHIIDPNYFVRPGHLADVSINGMFQSLRRRIRSGPSAWRSARAIGSVHVSLDREPDGTERWTPHIHLTLAVRASKHEVERVLRPKRQAPSEFVGRKFRPIRVERIDNLANAISYATKVNVDTRGAAIDGRGNRDRTAFILPVGALREHDRWLLDSTPRERVFLAGMMITRGGLSLRNREG